MKHPIRLLAASAFALALSFPALAETVTINFVQTNDIDRMEDLKGRGGFAKVEAVVAAERAKGPTLFIHAGDTISPSLLSGIDKGAHVIDILNQMGVDIFTPGNHEFDFGPDVFHARIGEAKFPVITSNIREKDGSQPKNTTDDKMVEIGGVKIGFYGLTTEDTPVVATAGDTVFNSSIETGKAKEKALRAAGADLVVAVVHTPLSVDMALVRNRAADLVFSGHDEHLLAFFDGKTALTESGSQGDNVIVTRVTIDKTEKDGKTTVAWQPHFEIIDTKDITPDPKIAAVVKTYQDELDSQMKVEIGKTETPLDSRRATVRGEEAAIGNLVADATRAAVGADIAITNGGGIRADREYPAGATLTRGDVFAELPFGNKTVKLVVTGDMVKAALENGFSQVEGAAGRFPQVSGLVVTVDLNAAPGMRVKSVMVDGAPLDPARKYTLATNDYMADGGDGYVVFKDAARLVGVADGRLMASEVIDYIADKKTIAPVVEGRIKPVS
ncbi:5'-nucleotidase C-terminal domain-containing protein [Kaistia dalseonensis]|uniref:2',3'-cyclic-nucleotide 2'-phosphodiesterase (5'-nucleotidase family) n=1 Tax=Kaistia dalseonensis TaxID=410840 RepID=A0ABU0HAZ5_9HYPH|nr:5'-nucleotidase C-terminal domain-containing protein [Kaistia dalseonensis]MCX5496861.1 5'-nucleotidase C-terminal domain-containing protein [Kaistia dalseonensis]MDQ0439487.1 2',3'-cyclic-nucleotide 2'-phosphodiesterase (5'-nucleotidase family) [Kaistia dalseonensis]